MLVSCFFHPVTIIQSSNAAAGPFFITKSTFSHGCCRDGLFLRGPESDHCHNPHSHGLNLIGAGLLPVGPSRPVLGVLARNPLRLSAVGYGNSVLLGCPRARSGATNANIIRKNLSTFASWLLLWMQAFHCRELVIAPESHNQHTPQALVTARGRLGRKSGVIQTLKILKNQMTPVSHHHPALVAGQALQEIVSFEILFLDFLSGVFFRGKRNHLGGH